jgi:DnaK suppressor protein
MGRKDEILNIKQFLVKRLDALRKALAVDLGSAQDEITTELVELEKREIVRAESALERMEKGDYGVCACGADIQIARLRALPYATHCIRCRREEEVQGAVDLSPSLGPSNKD